MIILTGKVQEEEEKKAQEAWKEKEKEGSISFRLWLWLKDVALKATHFFVVFFFFFFAAFSSCSADHIQAADMHVSNAAVILMTLREARVPLCCQHRYIS